jgi:hypothetical protein
LIKVGDDQVYTATVNWSDGSQTTETATWTSDNSSVATIDGTGKAHGVNSGEASLVAATTHGTGVLKIRVVPNYQGTWTGDYTVRGCTANGSFSGGGWCDRGGFAVNSIFPIKLALTQNADKVTGTINIGQIATTVDATTSVAIDGGLNGSAQGTDSENGFSFTITINPLNFRANGPSMSGSFTQKWTATGYSGGATISSDLNAVPRTASVMVDEFRVPPRLSSLSDLLRAVQAR